MSTVTAGSFTGRASAHRAVDALIAAGFDSGRIAGFHIDLANPAVLREAREDSSTSAETQRAEAGAINGTLAGIGLGTIVGLATFPILGPAGPMAGAAVGAYMGSFAGVLDGMDGPPHEKPTGEAGTAESGGTGQPAGILVAVASTSPEEHEQAVTVLRAHGAAALESVEGEIVGGQWSAFEPKPHGSRGPTATPAPAA